MVRLLVFTPEQHNRCYHSQLPVLYHGGLGHRKWRCVGMQNLSSFECILLRPRMRPRIVVFLFVNLCFQLIVFVDYNEILLLVACCRRPCTAHTGKHEWNKTTFCQFPICVVDALDLQLPRDFCNIPWLLLNMTWSMEGKFSRRLELCRI